MNAAEFAALLRRLCDADVQVFADGDLLRYDAPAETATPQLLEELKRGKAALLEWITADAGHAEVVSRSLPAYGQQELWRRARTSPVPAVYGVSQRVSFTGPFDREALESSLSRLVARHEPLRAKFRSFPDPEIGDEQPVWETTRARPARLELVDLSDQPQPEEALNAHCRPWLAMPFALDAAPLWHARLYRLAPERHVLSWTVHHAACDGWSLATLLDELLAGYEAALRGEQPPAEPPSPTLADFARRQRRELAGPRGEQLAAYWRAALWGAPLRLDFPYDVAPPPRPEGRGGIRAIGVPAATLAQLRAVARELGSTLYLTALSAYAVNLSRFTGQDEVVLPVSHANRAEPGYESTVGMLADRIPIRARVAAASTFADLAAQVGQAVFAGMDHQALPLSLLTAALPPEQRPTSPYPAALFTLLERGGCRQLPGMDVDVGFDAPEGLARMELYCFVTAESDGLHGAIEYAADRFSPATIDRFADGFVDVLERAAADPDFALR